MRGNKFNWIYCKYLAIWVSKGYIMLKCETGNLLALLLSSICILMTFHKLVKLI